MMWLNISVSVARSPEYIGSEPTQRSTWFSLMAYCAEQENGGVIQNCLEWGDRRWQQTAAVTLDEVNDCCDLFWFEDGNLLVAYYPTNREMQVAAGRAGGAKGGRPRKDTVEPSEKPSLKPSPKPEDKIREDKESKEREDGDEKVRPAVGLLDDGAFDVMARPSPAGASKAAATARVMSLLAWVCHTWQPRLTPMEQSDLAVNLSIWEDLPKDDWRLLRWWYQVRRPKLVADSKPGERIFPGSDRAYLLSAPTKCLDAIREKWQAARCPNLEKAGAKAKRVPDSVAPVSAPAEPHPMELLLETDPERYAALSREVWEGPLSAVDEIVIRGEKADPALALMRVHDLMMERIEERGARIEGETAPEETRRLVATD